MSTHNICFCGEIRKYFLIPLLSEAMTYSIIIEYWNSVPSTLYRNMSFVVIINMVIGFGNVIKKKLESY